MNELIPVQAPYFDSGPAVYFHRVKRLETNSPCVRLRVQCLFENTAEREIEIYCRFSRDITIYSKSIHRRWERGWRGIIGTSGEFTLDSGELFCQTTHSPMSDHEFRDDIELELPLDELDKAFKATIQQPDYNGFGAWSVSCQLRAFYNNESITTAVPHHVLWNGYRPQPRSLIFSTKAKRGWWRQFRAPEIF